MPTFVVTAPDGKDYEVDAPAGATQEQALAYFKQNWKPATTPAPVNPAEAAAPRQPTELERLAANPLMRALLATGSPFMGAGEWLPKNYGGEFFAEQNRELKRLQEAGSADKTGIEKALEVGGELAGSIMSPAFLKLAKVLGPAKTLGEVAKQGALTGAVGGATATTGTSDLEGKAITTAASTATGGLATPALVGTARGAGNMLAPVVSEAGARRGAAKLVAKAAEQDAPTVAAALAAAKQGPAGETAAQLLTPLQRPEMSALQTAWQSRMPTEYRRNLLGQEELQSDLLARLNAQTTPVKERIAATADDATAAMLGLPKLASEMRAGAAQSVDDVRRLEQAGSIARAYDIAGIPTLGSGPRPVIGSGLTQAGGLADIAERGSQAAADRSITQGAIARIAEAQIGSYADRGLKPLMAADLASLIRDRAKSDAVVTNRPGRNLLNALARDVEMAAKPDGSISVEALHTLRKTGINTAIESFSQGNPQLAKQLKTKELLSIKGEIDDMIENAGGAGWKDYLRDYSTRRAVIERPLERMDEVKSMAPEAAVKIGRLLNDEHKWTSVNLLNPVITAINAVMRGAEGVAGERVNRAGARLMLPENTAELGQLMQLYLARPQGLLGDAARYQGAPIQYGTGLLAQPQ